MCGVLEWGNGLMVTLRVSLDARKKRWEKAVAAVSVLLVRELS